MFKKTLAVLAGVAIAFAAYAATTHLKPGHPDQYVVKQGDTLWSIAARFLTRPWYWPEVWQANPQVHNPHLIYPGDVLNLGYDHQGEPVLKLEPSVHTAKTPVPAIPLAQLKMFLKDMRVVSPDTLKQSPYVLAFQENELRGVPGQFVYVRQMHAKPGQHFAIVRPSHVFRQYGKPGADSDIVAHDLDASVAMVPGPWQENFRNDGHFGTGKELGIEVQVIGTAEVLRTGDPTTLLITSSRMEIRKGDRLLPVNEHPYDAYYYPHAPSAVPPDARVIAFSGALIAVGKRQVVALSIGSDDGAENGQTYAVFQPGMTVNDDVKGNGMRRTFGDHVKLPSEFVGHVMVFRTFQHVSYGLIMDGIRPVKLGDTLKLPE